MKIENKGIEITDLKAVQKIEVYQTGSIRITLNSEESLPFRAEELHQVVELRDALTAAIDAVRAGIPGAAVTEDRLNGPWHHPEDIPAHLTEVYDKYGDRVSRESGRTWAEALWAVDHFGPWRADRAGGPWHTPDEIPAHLTTVYDRDGDQMHRGSGDTWGQTLSGMERWAPWRAEK